MVTSNVSIPGPLVLVYSGTFVTDLENRLMPFLQEVDGLARGGLLPVTLEVTRQGGWRMAVYAARYVAWLYPTRAEDAYKVGHAARRQFRDEGRLVERALMMHCAGGIRAFPDLRAVNGERSAGRLAPGARYGEYLWREWKAAGKAQAPEPVPDRRLDQLERVVEASQEIEAKRYAAMPPYHYVSRSATVAQRRSERAVYRFRIPHGDLPAVNTMIYLGDSARVRGKVFRVEGRDVTVRFEPGADYGSIDEQGIMRPLPSDRIFRAQRDAIAQLRERRMVNPALAETLLSARYQPFQVTTRAEPGTNLDPFQRDVFRRALDVPDVLNVLGPPGAGKTTTIVEVVKSSVALGRRVLITSHTHRAVDNVLEGLPPDLAVVRIGSEDNIGAQVRSLSSESRAATVRREILDDTALFDALSKVDDQRPVLDRCLGHLRSAIDQAGAAHAELGRLETALAAAVELACGPLRLQLGQAESGLARHRAAAEAGAAALVRAERRAQRAQAKVDAGAAFVAVWRWLLARRLRRADRLRADVGLSMAAAGRAEATLRDLRGRAERVAADDPQVAHLRVERAHIQQKLAGVWPELTRTGEFLRSLFQAVAAIPPPPAGQSPADWTAFHQWCEWARTTADRRLAVLTDWRQRVGDLGDELEREVARYAQVVGATCIGTETSALISDLEFDLAVVDEAGQISTPNLLVPLVRSRRAMLVGDHNQLPPFLDEEVREWAGGDPEAEQLGTLVARSGFELLFRSAPEANARVLRKQRRMPVEIAEFVSTAFYFGQLETEHPGGIGDAVFRSPFAMVDMSDQEAAQRRETAMNGRGASTRRGYRNEAEAAMIVELIAALSGQYRDWAVIVPYNAQKELIARRLAAELGPAAVEGNIGSVDSFQGGERDLIVFGFTRSNSRGGVGFLRELRRFNVAITRARRQLVLVGDLHTLLAGDERFHDLMRDMKAHLDRTGDRRPSAEVAAALAACRERS
ncbi:DEAD/DEAH box helicase [Actinoplanes sp. NPDC051513]|uniref:DEAD/DEAH box helicase n=1 Tax=Actinoplanes sp. NPDC051513 TaxID=3363908 RepID=UPI0037B90DB3